MSRSSLLASTVAVALFAGCGGSPGTAVLLTVRFQPGTPAEVIGAARRLKIEVSGGETFSSPAVVLDNRLQGDGSITIRYRPLIRSGTLLFSGSALDEGGQAVASGLVSSEVQADRELTAVLLLAAQPIPNPDLASPGDSGLPDLLPVDGARLDAQDDAPAMDLGRSDLGPDLAAPDLARADGAADLAARDLAAADQRPGDQGSGADLAVAPDLSVALDLALLPDLAPSGDLVGTCLVDGDCEKGRFCSGGTCKPKRAGGQSCLGDGDSACLSGNCANDTCAPCPKDMVHLAAGTFTMGAMGDNQADPDETPQHAVTLDGYCVDLNEATVADYRACALGGKCPLPMKSSDNANCTYTDQPGGNEQRPITCITWGQARTFCEWSGNAMVHAQGGRRLPTEAEWERQARGLDKRIYPWGNTAPDCTYANYRPNNTYCVMNDPRTRQVGSYGMKGRSASGTNDCAGNVFEWVNDWYLDNYYNICRNGCSNPAGPLAGTQKVIRGGAYSSAGALVRTTYRDAADPAKPSVDIGVRCVTAPF